MTTSTLIARLMGPVLLAMGIGMGLGLVGGGAAGIDATMMKDFIGSPSAFILVGVLALVAGLAIVNAHNLWVGDWRVIITILGWFAIIRGVLTFLFPLKVHSAGETIMGSTAGPVLCLVVTLVLGAILTAMGYEELWAEPKRRPAAASSGGRSPRRPARRK